jgi:hypothetical protein
MPIDRVDRFMALLLGRPTEPSDAVFRTKLEGMFIDPGGRVLWNFVAALPDAQREQLVGLVESFPLSED